MAQAEPEVISEGRVRTDDMMKNSGCVQYKFDLGLFVVSYAIPSIDLGLFGVSYQIPSIDYGAISGIVSNPNLSDI